jgi:hypothetical protein
VCIATTWNDDCQSVVVVVGAAGSREFEAEFSRWAAHWRTAAESASAEFLCLGLTPEEGPPDRDRLRAILAEKAASGAQPLWLVLIGHGTYDGKKAKYNLRGPDVTDVDLAEWLAPFKRPVAVIDCTSASGTFINRLSADNRVVVTATKSGHEQNYARFGQYLAEAVADQRADLDKDGQVSLLEAFLTASARVAEFYKSQSRLATEHGLIDDNGDRLGTPADWFHGVRATRRAKDGSAVDGVRAHQYHLLPSARERELPAGVRERRNQLELEVATLRNEKDKLGEDEYYSRLEKLMLELARLYAAHPAAPDKPKTATRSR